MAKGFKSGGRRAGTPNRATLERAARARAGTEAALATGAPSSCRLWAGRVGRPRTMLAQSSGCGSDLGDVGPRLERTRPCGSMLAGGDVVAAKMEEVVDLVVGREESLNLPR